MTYYYEYIRIHEYLGDTNDYESDLSNNLAMSANYPQICIGYKCRTWSTLAMNTMCNKPFLCKYMHMNIHVLLMAMNVIAEITEL